MVSEQPGGRPPAPEVLVPVQNFVNTANLEVDPDPNALETIEPWAAERGVTAPEDLSWLIGVRETLRSWIAGGGNAPDALADALREVDLRVVVLGGALRLVGGTPVGAACAPVVEAILQAQAVGTWSRLKACERYSCRWVYYDHSKNGGSRWCSSALCGAREKSRRARARQSGTLAKPGSAG